MDDAGSVTVANRVELLPVRGMIMLRGSLNRNEFAGAVTKAFGTAVPKSGRIVRNMDRELAWMSPDELLGFLPIDGLTDTVAALDDSLAGQRCLVADVSSLRSEFEIEGAVRDILAKGTPADMSPEAFSVGQFRRSRIGQLQAAFWLTGDSSARVICRRSESEHMQDWLTAASSEESAPRYFHRSPFRPPCA